MKALRTVEQCSVRIGINRSAFWTRGSVFHGMIELKSLLTSASWLKSINSAVNRLIYLSSNFTGIANLVLSGCAIKHFWIDQEISGVSGEELLDDQF